MVTLQDRIKNIEEYRPDINFKDGTFILKIKFKQGWSIIEPADSEEVAFAEDKTVPNLYWYVSTIENSDMIFDVIEETISVNKEMEKKLTLYKEKVKELQDLFLSNETYERLVSLKFVIPEDKKKSKRYQKKAEVQKNDDIEAINTSDDNKVQTDEENALDGVVIPSETIIDGHSDIDDKILMAIGE